jgi:hypothetical protein
MKNNEANLQENHNSFNVFNKRRHFLIFEMSERQMANGSLYYSDFITFPFIIGTEVTVLSDVK